MKPNPLTRVAISTAAAAIAFVPFTRATRAWQTQQTATYHPAARVCVLHDFGTQAVDALAPSQIGAIALGDDGWYYSTSPSGGKSTVTANQGTIFRFSPTSNGVDVRYSFDTIDHGSTPRGGLIKGNDGYFYGTTYAGGSFKTDAFKGTKFGSGVLFRFKPGDKEPDVVHTFRYGDLTGINPEVCPPKKPCHWSPQQKMNAAGGIPLSAPVLATDGNLYGVTSGAVGFPNLGVLYKVAPYKGESAITALCIGGPMPPLESDISDQDLRDLCMFNGKHGNLPLALSRGSNVLFGTTIQTTPSSGGTVFRAELPSGIVTTLYNFTDPKNGRIPYGVIPASDGNLYGLTGSGGPLYGPGNPGAGVLYRLSPSGGNFEIVHAFNGTTEGSQPVAGLVESASPDGSSYLYGSTVAGGNLRGVLFRQRIRDGSSIQGDPYQVLHAFPREWSVTGSFPASTMLPTYDTTYGLTFYGTTISGGITNNGVLFRLRGSDLPPVRNLASLPLYSLRHDSKHLPQATVTIPGQPQPATIDVFADAVAQQGSSPPSSTLTDDGLMIRIGNCRSPHIIQFVYREQIGAAGNHIAGSYTPSNQQSYPLTTDLADKHWHTDTSGVPNAYYDEQYRVPVLVNSLGMTFFDQPNFNGTTYSQTEHQTSRATFKDYVICNCQVIQEVLWAREVDINKGLQGTPRYVNLAIIPPTDDPTLDWANKQIRSDGFNPVP